MRKMNLLYSFAVFSAFSMALTGCESDEPYISAMASSIDNAITIAIVETTPLNLSQFAIKDNKGNPLSFKVDYRDLSTQLLQATYIIGEVPTPDERKMVYNEDQSEGYGYSTIKLTHGGSPLSLKVRFRYVCNNPGEPMYGNSSLRVDSIAVADTVFSAKRVVPVSLAGTKLRYLPL